MFNSVAVKREVYAGDEVGIRVKEQSIIELGKLFDKTRQAEGNEATFDLLLYFVMLWYIHIILGMRIAVQLTERHLQIEMLNSSLFKFEFPIKKFELNLKIVTSSNKSITAYC